MGEQQMERWVKAENREPLKSYGSASLKVWYAIKKCHAADALTSRQGSADITAK